jgi:hypothetical protein
MELLAFLRWLLRHPIPVVLGVVIAAGIAFMSAQGQHRTFGVATQRLVLDTPKSQLLNADPKGADTLPWRAAMLSEMTATGSVEERIARSFGVPARNIGVISMKLTNPQVESPLTMTALKAEAEADEPYLVGVGFDERLPLISVATRAPDRPTAARLAEVTTAALMAAASAPYGAVAPQGLVVETIGRPRTREVVDGPRRLVAVVIFGILLSLWCVGIALVSRIRDALRSPPTGALALHRWEELAPLRDLPRVEPRPARAPPFSRRSAPS